LRHTLTAATVVQHLRLGFSAAAFTTHECYKLAADREHLASSLRKAGLPE
jgi:hypothetical protein